MHGEAMQQYGHSQSSWDTRVRCRRQRQMRRWCLAGFLVIPLMLGFLWLQFAAARGDGQWRYADHVCDCRAVLAPWVSDYVWTQMIWLPGNMLFLLIWVALAVKLWSGGRRGPRCD